MATKWMRAAWASSFILLRASRSGLAHPRRLQLSSVRWNSAAAAQQKAPELMSSERPKAPSGEAEGSSITDKLPAFETLKGKICPQLLKAITVKPFQLTHMSVVQAAVLPLLPGLATPYDPENPSAERKDLLVKAKTGTGKTLGFLVPAVEARLNEIEKAGRQAVIDAGLTDDKHLEARARRVFARTHAGCLIISPTRELATQIANEALRLTTHLDDFEVRLFVGGMSKKMQMRDWMKGRRDIVVATPGRIRDMLESEPEIAKGLAQTRMLILDEADTLLEMGFREEITAITEFIAPKKERQTFLFSATVSREIQQIAHQVLDKNHVFVNCVSADDSPVHAHVPQYHTVLPGPGHQLLHIMRLIAHDQLSNPGKSKTIMFLPTTKMTQLFATFIRALSGVLPARDHTHIYEIHSKRSQDQRTNTSDRFRRDQSGASVLISSDVSARGIDYPGVTRVIQVGIPGGTDQYIHRVGRTGRGREGHGRADLVLLPWEAGFVSWQLTDIPLKPVTVNELAAQVMTLAEKHDADPKSFFGQITPRDPRSRGLGPVAFDMPYSPLLNKFGDAITQLMGETDEEAVRETTASLIGYYFGKSPELRCQKSVILQGLKDWATDACGMPVAPFFSESFLQRLGLDDGRTKRFGSGRFQARSQPEPENRWSGRGNVRRRTDDRFSEDKPVRRFRPLDSRDPSVSPEELRGARYRR